MKKLILVILICLYILNCINNATARAMVAGGVATSMSEARQIMLLEDCK